MSVRVDQSFTAGGEPAHLVLIESALFSNGHAVTVQCRVGVATTTVTTMLTKKITTSTAFELSYRRAYYDRGVGQLMPRGPDRWIYVDYTSSSHVDAMRTYILNMNEHGVPAV